MRFTKPLIRGRLIVRYKRFLADIELAGGEIITAHCANPGSMLGLKEEGSTVWLSKSDDPKRKLAYSWELLELADGALVGINTAHPNGIVADAITAGKIPVLAAYSGLRREVNYGRKSRVDMLLTSEGLPDCYVEVKNAHLSRKAGLAEFPDSVTARGARHLEELGDMVKAGHRAMMVFLVQRNDCSSLSLARDLDPAYGTAFDRALARGVEVTVLGCHITREEITGTDILPFAG